MSVRNLEHLFQPRSIAVVGASTTPDTVGATVMRNLLQGGFAGPIMPVNPHHDAVAGVLGYADVAALVERGFGLALLPRSTCRSIAASRLTVSDLDLSRKVQAYGVAGRQRSVAAAGLVRLLRAADWSDLAA